MKYDPKIDHLIPYRGAQPSKWIHWNLVDIKSVVNYPGHVYKYYFKIVTYLETVIQSKFIKRKQSVYKYVFWNSYVLQNVYIKERSKCMYKYFKTVKYTNFETVILKHYNWYHFKILNLSF